jgi:hypothetical protein
MISNTGRYWSTGITVCWRDTFDRSTATPADTWAASLDFLDSGFADDDPDAGKVSTEGTLRTRYFVHDGNTVSGLSVAVDTLIADAKRLGIGFNDPCLYYQGDGEGGDYPPPNGWREILAAESERIGWRNLYEARDAIREVK